VHKALNKMMSPKLIKPQWLIFICFTVLYTLTRTAVHGPAEDAWLMVLDITKVDFVELFHPHHLLYAPLARTWWRIWHFLGINDVFGTIQMLNCIIGSVALWQLFILCKDMRLSNLTSIWIVSMTGISFAVWWLSCEIETAAPAFLVGLIAIRCIYSLYRKGLTTQGIIISAMVTVIASTTHIFNLALGLLVCYVLLTTPDRVHSNNDNRNIRMDKNFFMFSGVFILVFTIGIFLVYTVIDFITASDLGAVGYMIGYFDADQSGGLSLKTPLLFGAGLIRSLFGVEILFRIPAVANLAISSFPAKDFTDELFMVRNMSVTFTYILMTIMLIITGVLSYISIIILRKFPKLNKDSKRDLLFIAAALFTVALPSVIAGPILSGATANNEHLLLFQALFFLNIGLVFERSGGLIKIHKITAISLFVLLLTVNGSGSISAMMRNENDLNISIFQKWKEVIKPSDLLVIKLTERDAAALSFLTGATSINLMHEKMPDDDSLIDWIEKRNANIWIQQDMALEGVKYPPVEGFRMREWQSWK